MSNTSGGGANAAVPAEIDRWNWGAFLLNWIWGIRHNTWLALLVFVPFINIAVLFLLGKRGSAWAWQNNRWASVAQFRAVQRRWAQWGVATCAFFAAACVGLFFAITAFFKNTEPYKLALAKLESHALVQQALGQPLSTGLPMGDIHDGGARGSANLSFSVEGPNGSATAYVLARKEFGQWTIERMVLEDEATGRRADLVP